MILGYNKANDVYYENKFKDLGLQTKVSTISGEYGQKGVVTDVINLLEEEKYYVYTCGPEMMLKAIYKSNKITDGQFSFEERMGCGFGACMGCSCKTKYGSKKICTDGPILQMGEIIW